MGFFRNLIRGVRELRLVRQSDVENDVEQAKIDAVEEDRVWRKMEDLGKVGVASYEDDAFIYEAVDRAITFERQARAKGAVKRLKAAGNSVSGRVLREAEVQIDKWVEVGSSVGENLSRSQNLAELRLAQDAAVDAYNKHPHAGSAIDNTVRYCIGRGITFSCQAPDVQQALVENFWEPGDMEERQKEMVRDWLLEGELFTAFFKEESGNILPRKIPTVEMEGIVTDKEDVEKILGYRRVTVSEGKERTVIYRDVKTALRQAGVDKEDLAVSKKLKYPDVGVDDKDVKEEEEVYVLFSKVGYREERRGRVPMYRILRYLRYVKDFLADRVLLNHERSRIIMKKITKKGRRTPEETTRVRRPPRGGYVLPCTDTVDYAFMSPQTDAADAQKDYKSLLYTVGAGWTIPLYILDQNAENENYASIRKADTPFSQMILDRQDTWKSIFRRMFRFVILMKVLDGKLKPQYTITVFDDKSVAEARMSIMEMVFDGVRSEDIVREVKEKLGTGSQKEVVAWEMPLDINFPDVVHESPKEVAEVLKIHRELGLADQQTLSEKAGYNWEQVLYRKALEKKRQQEEDDADIAKYQQKGGPIPPGTEE